MDIEEINTDRDKFLEAISRNVEGELKKLGLKLINVNMTDISGENRGDVDTDILFGKSVFKVDWNR